MASVSEPAARVHVAAAAIFDGQGRVLIARRADHVHQGGLWEFPGGKVEAGESVHAALARELHEELGIGLSKLTQQTRPLIRVRHDYADKSVLLDVWRLEGVSGEALLSGGHGREGQPLKWVSPAELSCHEFPAANLPIVTALRLPDRYLITPDPGDDLLAFLSQLENRLREGVRLVQLRAKSLSTDAYVALARQCVALCRKYDACLMLNADPGVVSEVGADGVHLDSGRLNALQQPPFNADSADVAGVNKKWVSASCHSQQQLAQAKQLGADFVLLSPVAATASHPGDEPLGWQGFQALAELAACPAYALGGMTARDIDQAFVHGAQGVAAIRALWEVSD